MVYIVLHIFYISNQPPKNHQAGWVVSGGLAVLCRLALEAKSKLQLRSGALRLAFSQRPSMQKAEGKGGWRLWLVPKICMNHHTGNEDHSHAMVVEAVDISLLLEEQKETRTSKLTFEYILLNED